MNGHRESKLKSLIQSIPSGFLVDTGWLAQHAISRQSVSGYVKQGWLERVASGVYRRPFGASASSDAAGSWKIPLLSAQQLMGYAFHVGGTSALSLHGHTHYLSLGREQPINLYGADIPSWLLKLPVEGGFIRHGTTLLGESNDGIENTAFNLADSNDAELTLSPWRWPIRMSAPERAILEALDELPSRESFHTLDVAFEGLVNLRPKLLTSLLTQCRSVKVKRLFFVYADRHAHAWLKHVDKEAVDLGQGDRALASGDRLHPVYRIMVPAELIRKEDGHGA